MSQVSICPLDRAASARFVVIGEHKDGRTSIVAVTSIIVLRLTDFLRAGPNFDYLSDGSGEIVRDAS